MLKFELQKLIRKRSVQLIGLAAIAITAILSLLPVLSAQYYTKEGVHTGLQAIQAEKAVIEEHSAVLTDDFVRQKIIEIKEAYSIPENTVQDGQNVYLIQDSYWNLVAPQEDLLNLIAKTYAPAGMSVDYSYLNTLDPDTLAPFYQQIQTRRTDLLNQPSRHLSEKEKAFWLSKAESIQEPYTYNYAGGWKALSSGMELMIIPIVLICLLLADLYAREYRTGMDSLLLSSKYGRTKLVWAKTGAAFILAAGLFLICLLVCAGITLGTHGFDGWNLPVQTASTLVPYPISFLQSALVSVLLCLLVLWGMTALTLYLSAALGSSYSSAILIILLSLIPVFLIPSSTAGLFNKILYLLPYQAVVPDFGKYLCYQIGPIVLDGIWMKSIVYLVMGFVFVPLSGAAFRRHEPGA